MKSSYMTPKRRHSSLFQRMQQQIQKISRKLSITKSTARGSSFEKQKSNHTKYITTGDRTKQKSKIFKQVSFDLMDLMENAKKKQKNVFIQNTRQPSIVQTVRIKHMPYHFNNNINKIGEDYSFSPLSKHKTLTSKTLNKRINLGSYLDDQIADNIGSYRDVLGSYRCSQKRGLRECVHDQRIRNLQKENQDLNEQIKNLQLVCEDQIYNFGYATAYYKDKQKQLKQKNSELHKENIYLRKLCEHYQNERRHQQNRKAPEEYSEAESQDLR